MTAETLHTPPRIEVVDLSKRFGDVQALERVSVAFEAGRFHALLGENGAGKSTLVKCLLGYYKPDSGRITIDGHAYGAIHPRDADELGLGMVYQHFTLVSQMTVAENFVLGRNQLPAFINWKAEYEHLRAFMAGMPFRLDPGRRVSTLAAGEKQKLEILKQLYLGRRFLVLDEPTSVLTPAEADEVLGQMRALVDQGRLTVVLITHKFREVEQFAQDVTVLRSGRVAGHLEAADATRTRLAGMMFDAAPVGKEAATVRARPADGVSYLDIAELRANGDRGTPALTGASMAVRPGEIVGVAGVSGNGQKELVEVLAGQRAATAGTVRVAGKPFACRRREIKRAGVSLLTEEPLVNGAVRSLSVMENLALRQFDEAPLARGGWLLKRYALVPFADALIRRYRIRTPSPAARLDALSGGNVQRVVLARELSREVRLLIMQNPCFGLDAAAAAEIRKQILQVRGKGGAVLLISEDLDEIMELSDRILVMSGGRITYETDIDHAEIYEIGRHMADAAHGGPLP